MWKGQQKNIRGQVETFRLNILASAYKCAPDKDSESEVGWQWVFNLGKHHRITAITRKHEDPIIIHKLIKENGSDVRFIYYELPKCLRFLEKGNINHFIYYSLWQLGAFFLARKLVLRERFDLVQHFVFVNTWQPTYMPFLGIPFFFGPIGENVPIPLRILRHHGIKSIIRELVGGFIKHTSRNYNPIMRAIYNRAARIIVINSSVYLKIRPKLRNKTFVIPAPGGFSINQNIKGLVDKDESNFTVLFVGRFVPIKNPDIAIEAFLKFSKNHNNVKLIVIGGGPMEDKLCKIIEIESTSNKVMILGWLERQKVQSYLEACDVLLFPTLEGGAGVVLEAMSVRKPVICLDHGGPRDYITETCGIKVKVTTRKKIINDLAVALEKTYCSKQLRVNAGLAALQRFNEAYTWEKKIEQMNELYKEVLVINN